MNINIADFMNKEIPPDILEQLQVVGRVKHFLKPTTTSAISTAEDQPYDSDQREVEKDINNLIDEVKVLEDLVEQLEDLADEHLKDMSIPPQNDMVAAAVKQLGGDTITKPILDKALTIIDYLAMMNLGQDPFLAALTGDGAVTGPRLACAEMDPQIGKQLKQKARNPYTAEQVVKDAGSDQEAAFQKKLADMMIDILLNLLFKKLWPFIVDIGINSLRLAVANPLDGLIGFFQSSPRFRRKKAEWLKSHGACNKALNWLRKLLLCSIPPHPGGVMNTKTDYRPQVEDLNCSEVKDKTCPPITDSQSDIPESKDTKTSEYMGSVTDAVDNGGCVDSNDLMENIKMKTPETFGVSPECIESAKIVINAVESDIFTPPTFED